MKPTFGGAGCGFGEYDSCCRRTLDAIICHSFSSVTSFAEQCRSFLSFFCSRRWLWGNVMVKIRSKVSSTDAINSFCGYHTVLSSNWRATKENGPIINFEMTFFLVIAGNSAAMNHGNQVCRCLYRSEKSTSMHKWTVVIHESHMSRDVLLQRPTTNIKLCQIHETSLGPQLINKPTLPCSNSATMRKSVSLQAKAGMEDHV